MAVTIIHIIDGELHPDNSPSEDYSAYSNGYYVEDEGGIISGPHDFYEDAETQANVLYPDDE